MPAPPNELRRPGGGGARSIIRKENRLEPYTAATAAEQIPPIIARHWWRGERGVA